MQYAVQFQFVCLIYVRYLFIFTLRVRCTAHTFFHTFRQKNGEWKYWLFFGIFFLLLNGVNCHVCDLCIYTMFRMSLNVLEVRKILTWFFFPRISISKWPFFISFVAAPDTGCINIVIFTAIIQFFLSNCPNEFQTCNCDMQPRLLIKLMEKTFLPNKDFAVFKTCFFLLFKSNTSEKCQSKFNRILYIKMWHNEWLGVDFCLPSDPMRLLWFFINVAQTQA